VTYTLIAASLRDLPLEFRVLVRDPKLLGLTSRVRGLPRAYLQGARGLELAPVLRAINPKLTELLGLLVRDSGR